MRLWSWSGHAWLSLPMRWYLSFVFISACLHKIAHPALFALDIATYDILPLSLINVVALGLPWCELTAGIMLLVGYKSRVAGLMVSGMMVVFVIALFIALARGLDMSCGCFASQGALDEDPISTRTVLRDLGWLALSVYVFLFDRNALGIDRILHRAKENHA